MMKFSIIEIDHIKISSLLNNHKVRGMNEHGHAIIPTRKKW